MGRRRHQSVSRAVCMATQSTTVRVAMVASVLARDRSRVVVSKRPLTFRNPSSLGRRGDPAIPAGSSQCRRWPPSLCGLGGADSTVWFGETVCSTSMLPSGRSTSGWVKTRQRGLTNSKTRLCRIWQPGFRACRCCCSPGSGRSSTNSTRTGPRGIPTYARRMALPARRSGRRGHASELGRRLGISKQAAGKKRWTAWRASARRPGRRRRGRPAQAGPAHARASIVGPGRRDLDDLQARGPILGRTTSNDLRRRAAAAWPADGFRLDVAGWFSV